MNKLGPHVIPRTHRRLSNRAFAVAAPSSWNCLPDNVRKCQSYNRPTNFLSKFKTCYFNTAFNDLLSIICTIYHCTVPLSYGLGAS